MKNFATILLCVLSAVSVLAEKRIEWNSLVDATSHNWRYNAENGPLTWKAESDQCGSGQRQSPVDLNDATCVKATLPALDWDGHWEYREEGFVLRNTWHTVEVTYEGDEAEISGGPLNDEYKLSQVHFHWGGQQNGSEHALDNHFYGMEVHLVHYKAEYEDVETAKNYSDGLTVIAILYEDAEQNNTDFDELVRGVREVHDGDSFVQLPGNAMKWLKNHVDAEHYYTYQGSLTTPPCSEIVTWIVMKHSGTIGIKQVQEFQKIKGHDGEIKENARPVQPINGRPVFYSSGTSSLNSRLLLILPLLAALVLRY